MMQQQNNIIVKHTPDRMKAFVALAPGKGEGVTRDALIMELFNKNIVHGLDLDKINMVVASPIFGKYIEVAQGTPAKPGTDGHIELLVASKDKSKQDFIIVKAMSPIARHMLPKRGTDGTDIFGASVEPPPVTDCEIKYGEGTQISPRDPNVLIAKIDGVINRTDDGTIEVCPYVEINGDVSGDNGRVKFDGYLRVRGSVQTGSSIDVLGTLEIIGEIHGKVTIKCGGDLLLRAPVRGTAVTIECGGNVRAVSLENVKMNAEGNLTVSGEIKNSTVVCKGAISAEKIVGGSVSSVCGITAARVGGECGTRTTLDIGIVHTVVKDRDALRENIAAQKVLVEKCASDLYVYVRDSMKEDGEIPEVLSVGYNSHRKSLVDSIEDSKTLERKLDKVERLLETAQSSSIIAAQIFPNVLLNLGFSAQDVKERLTNVQLKPTGVKIK